MVPSLTRGSVIACLFCLLSMQAFASSVAEDLQKKYDTVGSMKSDFTQVLLHKETGNKETRRGTLLFKKPFLARWETKSPEPELLVITDTEIWDAFPDEEIAYKYPLSMARDSGNLVQVVTGQARLDKDFTVEGEGTENGLIKLRLYPKEPSQGLVEAVLWVHPDTKLIRRILAYDFFGNENDVTFANEETGIAIAASAFTFTPPAGCTVEDHTKGGGAGRKGKSPFF